MPKCVSAKLCYSDAGESNYEYLNELEQWIVLLFYLLSLTLII
jgi:hypothetical protein